MYEICFSPDEFHIMTHILNDPYYREVQSALVRASILPLACRPIYEL